MDQSLDESVRLSLLCLLEETLHSHQGVYLAEGTSLLETVAGIPPDVASRRYPGLDETIAGHVHHANAYLLNTLAMLKGQGDGSFDGPASWRITVVNAEHWSALQAELAKTYEAIMNLVSSAPIPRLAPALPAILGLVAHSAYHLGAVRQLKDLR